MCHRMKIAVINIANASFARGWQCERVCIHFLGRGNAFCLSWGKKKVICFTGEPVHVPEQLQLQPNRALNKSKISFGVYGLN